MFDLLTLLSSLVSFTARKRSVGQGNIFTSVCHSVHGWWGEGGYGNFPVCITGHMTKGVSASRGEGICIGEGGWADPPPWDTMGYGQQADGMHGTGMHFCCTLILSQWLSVSEKYHFLTIYLHMGYQSQEWNFCWVYLLRLRIKIYKQIIYQ